MSRDFVRMARHYETIARVSEQLTPGLEEVLYDSRLGVPQLPMMLLAPLTPDAASYIMPMLARVEGMPLETLKVGVPWSWTSFGEYLGLLDGKIGINAGFLKRSLGCNWSPRISRR